MRSVVITGNIFAAFLINSVQDSFNKCSDGLQVHNVRNAFISFFCVLCAYFLQLPTRDEAGVALGMLAPCEEYA